MLSRGHVASPLVGLISKLQSAARPRSSSDTYAVYGVVPVVVSRTDAVCVGKQPAVGLAEIQVGVGARLADAAKPHVQILVKVLEHVGSRVRRDSPAGVLKCLVGPKAGWRREEKHGGV